MPGAAADEVMGVYAGRGAAFPVYRQPYGKRVRLMFPARGTAESISFFGQNARTANEAQAANRAQYGFKGSGRYTRRRIRRHRSGRMRLKGRGLYTGRGGFWGDLWNRSSGLRSMAGNALRSSVNPWAAGAGQVMSALGVGEYEVSGGAGSTLSPVTNDIVQGGQMQGIPQFSSGPSSITISHKEYISDLFGPSATNTGGFQSQTYGLNPGLVTTFPWLSQVAANFEEYTFGQLIFTFRSTVTDFVETNGQVGTIIMATQYNADDTPFQSKQDMMEYDLAMSGKVSGNMLHGVECDPSQLSGAPGKYTRAGPVQQGEDIKTYDHGVLNIATSNTPAQFNNTSLGELWVSYTVQLRKPKFYVARGLAVQRDTVVGSQVSIPTAGGWVGGNVAGWNNIQLGLGQQDRIGGLTEAYLGSLANQPDTGGVGYPPCCIPPLEHCSPPCH